MDNPFDDEVQAALRRVLDPGESLLWCGRPRRGLLLRAADLYLIPFSLLWGGFAFFWEWGVLTHTGRGAQFMSIWGIPFVLAGCYMIFGRFFFDARLRAGTYYGLTDRRAIILAGLYERRVRSLPLRTLTDLSLEERADGSGTLLLARPQPYNTWNGALRWPGMGASSTPSFELIGGAKTVYQRLLQAQRAAG